MSSAQLIELISEILPFSDRCNWERISYRGKVELALSCGLAADTKSALEEIGTLGNDFAHTLSATISRNGVLDLCNGLSNRLKEGLK